MYQIIALGPNRLQVPCLFFKCKEQAEEFLKIAGCKADKTKDIYNNNILNTWFVPTTNNRKWWERFFTSYYGECGEVWGFIIQPIEIGKPFIPWDLD